MINYCHNINCQNNGICRPLLMNYTCECLGDSFSGRHCEDVATKIVVLRYVSKSVGYIAIIFLVCTALFFIIMDALKYIFGIDITKDELERIRKEKAKRKLHYRHNRIRPRTLNSLNKNNKIVTRKI